jgi:hypothetical protein
MKSIPTFAAIAALAMAPTAFAQEQTRTTTFEGPNATGMQTTTVDRAAGTYNRDREVTNTNTGNTASSNLNRQRTETGAVISGSQTGPQGNTRSFEGERVRTDGGSTFTGTATGRDGNSVDLYGNRQRDGQGNSSASQRVTNSAGDTLFARDRATTRSNGQVNHSVTRSGPKPPRVRRPR